MHQLRALYGERAGTFLSNAGVIQTFGVNDHATSDTLLLLRQGERPLWAGKVRYYDQREFADLFDPA